MAGDVVHVVDDDVDVRKSLGFLLATADFAVRLHESATAFLATEPKEIDGCIVTDVRMPGIDGIEFLRQLKVRGLSVPVIVMTGHADVALAAVRQLRLTRRLPKSGRTWPRCRSGSARCSTDSFPGCRIRRSRTISESARALLKSIAPTS